MVEVDLKSSMDLGGFLALASDSVCRMKGEGSWDILEHTSIAIENEDAVWRPFDRYPEATEAQSCQSSPP